MMGGFSRKGRVGWARPVLVAVAAVVAIALVAAAGVEAWRYWNRSWKPVSQQFVVVTADGREAWLAELPDCSEFDVLESGIVADAGASPGDLVELRGRGAASLGVTLSDPGRVQVDGSVAAAVVERGYAEPGELPCWERYGWLGPQLGYPGPEAGSGAGSAVEWADDAPAGTGRYAKGVLDIFFYRTCGEGEARAVVEWLGGTWLRSGYGSPDDGLDWVLVRASFPGCETYRQLADLADQVGGLSTVKFAELETEEVDDE